MAKFTHTDVIWEGQGLKAMDNEKLDNARWMLAFMLGGKMVKQIADLNGVEPSLVRDAWSYDLDLILAEIKSRAN